MTCSFFGWDGKHGEPVSLRALHNGVHHTRLTCATRVILANCSQEVVTMVIVDATKTEMTAPAVNRAKEIAAATKAKGIPDRPGVVVGLSGLQRAVAQLFGRGIHFASTIEEAKEWLVKEDEKRHWQRLFYGQRQRCGRCRLLSPGQLLSSTCHCPFGLTGL